MATSVAGVDIFSTTEMKCLVTAYVNTARTKGRWGDLCLTVVDFGVLEPTQTTSKEMRTQRGQKHNRIELFKEFLFGANAHPLRMISQHLLQRQI